MPDKAFPPDNPIPASFNEALIGMRNWQYIASQRYEAQQWQATRFGAHPVLLVFERLLVKRMAKLGVPMFAHEFLRSARKQDEAFKLGFSKARGGESPHQWGMAVDIVHGTKAWGLDKKQWDLIGHVGNELAAQRGFKIKWLGAPSSRFYDPAHWQIDNWRNYKEAYPWQTNPKP